MTEPGKLTAPIVRRSAGFHRNSTRRLGCKELHHVTPAQSLPKDDGTSSIRSVHLKHLLSQIQTNRANLVHGRLRSGDLNAPPWHIDAVAGASTPSLSLHPLSFRGVARDIFGRSASKSYDDLALGLTPCHPKRHSVVSRPPWTIEEHNNASSCRTPPGRRLRISISRASLARR